MSDIACAIDGDSDMYGLGIRIGFYLQWYGVIIADWIAKSEVPGLRNANSIFVAATFMGLIVRRDELSVPEVYIILLLFFGSTLPTPLLIFWRLLQFFDSERDPTRYSYSKPRGVTNIFFWSLLLIAELCFMLWYWAIKVPTLDTQLCERYGFMFDRVKLNSLGFRIFHLIFGCVLLVIVILLAIWGIISHKEDKEAAESVNVTRRTRTLIIINTSARLCTAVVVNAAVELTITWNRIQDVNSVGSVGQLIPLTVGVFALLRVLYIFLVGKKRDLLTDGISMRSIRARWWKEHRFVRKASSWGIPESGSVDNMDNGVFALQDLQPLEH